MALAQVGSHLGRVCLFRQWLTLTVHGVTWLGELPGGTWLQPKEDRRVTRTRKLLTEALISLSLEKGYEAVTIRDITDRAGVGYATFFRHIRRKKHC